MGDFHAGSLFCGAGDAGSAAPGLFPRFRDFYFLKKSNSFHTSDKRVRKRDQKTHGIRFTENKKHNFSTKPTKRGVKAPAFQREHLAARFSGFEASYPLIPLCEKDARPPEATKLAAYTSATP
jgi:hypothetical protein